MSASGKTGQHCDLQFLANRQGPGQALRDCRLAKDAVQNPQGHFANIKAMNYIWLQPKQ